MIICNRCLDGVHKCWPGDCACVLCGVELKKHAGPQPGPARERAKAAPRAKGRFQSTLTPEMTDHIARKLLEDAGSPHRISQPEWDAVAARQGWSHTEVASELGISYERVRYIRRMPRPTDAHLAPAYRDIAHRAGVTHGQVYKVMKDLVSLRDADPWSSTRPQDRPPEPCTFS